MDGGGKKKKKNVEWLLKYGEISTGFERSRLDQVVDEIDGKPLMVVNGSFWNKGGKFIQIDSLNKSHYKGTSCMALTKIGRITPICQAKDLSEFSPCLNNMGVGFLSDGTVKLSEIPDFYDTLKDKLDDWPKSKTAKSRYHVSSDEYPISYNENEYGVQEYAKVDRYCWVDVDKISGDGE